MTNPYKYDLDYIIKHRSLFNTKDIVIVFFVGFGFGLVAGLVI